MPKLSDASIKKLATCESQLQDLIREAIKITDLSVIWGHRSDEEQNVLFMQGKSKLRGGKSKHNEYPSEAVDIAPYPIDFSDRDRFFYLVGIIKATAFKLGIKIRFGCDWNSNDQFRDEKFQDLGHIELTD